MSLHTKRQGFHPLKHLECRGRAHTGTEVSRTFFAGTGDKRCGAKFNCEIHVVKAGIRFGHCWELSRGLPVESATVYQQTTNDDTVPT